MRNTATSAGTLWQPISEAAAADRTLLWPTCLQVQLLRDGRHVGLSRGMMTIVGATNTGKTALINFILGQQRLEQRNRAGVTTSVLGVRLPSGLHVYDTPGLDDRACLDEEVWSFLRTGRDVQGNQPRLLDDRGHLVTGDRRSPNVVVILAQPAGGRSFWGDVVPGVLDSVRDSEILVAIGRADTTRRSELRDAELEFTERLSEVAPGMRYVGSFSTITGDGLGPLLSAVLASLTSENYEGAVRRLWPALFTAAMRAATVKSSGEVEASGASEALRKTLWQVFSASRALHGGGERSWRVKESTSGQFEAAIESFTTLVNVEIRSRGTDRASEARGVLRAASAVLARFLAFSGEHREPDAWTVEDIEPISRWAHIVPVLAPLLEEPETAEGVMDRAEKKLAPLVVRLLIAHATALADGVLHPAEVECLGPLWDSLPFLPGELLQPSVGEIHALFDEESVSYQKDLLRLARKVAEADGIVCSDEVRWLESLAAKTPQTHDQIGKDTDISPLSPDGSPRWNGVWRDVRVGDILQTEWNNQWWTARVEAMEGGVCLVRGIHSGRDWPGVMWVSEEQVRKIPGG